MNKKRLIKTAHFALVGAAFLLIPRSTSKQADRLPYEDDKKNKDKAKRDYNSDKNEAESV